MNNEIFFFYFFIFFSFLNSTNDLWKLTQTIETIEIKKKKYENKTKKKKNNLIKSSPSTTAWRASSKEKGNQRVFLTRFRYFLYSWWQIVNSIVLCMIWNLDHAHLRLIQNIIIPFIRIRTKILCHVRYRIIARQWTISICLLFFHICFSFIIERTDLHHYQEHFRNDVYALKYKQH